MTKKNHARNPGQGSNWIRRDKRLAIYLRDGFACIYCGCGVEESGAPLTLDHVTPCELGGTNKASNLVTACLSCNSAKRDLRIGDFIAGLADRGHDPDEVAKRVRNARRRKIDRKAGKALLAARKGS